MGIQGVQKKVLKVICLGGFKILKFWKFQYYFWTSICRRFWYLPLFRGFSCWLLFCIKKEKYTKMLKIFWKNEKMLQKNLIIQAPILFLLPFFPIEDSGANFLHDRRLCSRAHFTIKQTRSQMVYKTWFYPSKWNWRKFMNFQKPQLE